MSVAVAVDIHLARYSIVQNKTRRGGVTTLQLDLLQRSRLETPRWTSLYKLPVAALYIMLLP